MNDDEDRWRYLRYALWLAVLWMLIVTAWSYIRPQGRGAPLPFKTKPAFGPGVYVVEYNSNYLRLASDGTAAYEPHRLDGLGAHMGKWWDQGDKVKVEWLGHTYFFPKRDLRRLR